MTQNQHPDPDELIFAEEEAAAPVSEKYWKILIVDDDLEVHKVTKLILHNFEFDGRGLLIFDAYTSEQGRQILEREEDIAVILLDVVMERDDAGLRLVRYIRNVLQNKAVRIVLRTAQPGQAPEEKVITEYDINDYKEKTELTASKLRTTIIASLRSYRDIKMVEQARLEAENANKAKSSFLANMSHEIRTPMNAIVGLAEILNTMDLSKEQQKEYAGIIYVSAQSLLRIINDILDLSRIEAGKISIEKSLFDLNLIMQETLETFMLPARQKGLALQLNIDPRLDRPLLGDSTRLKQILYNLIGNAIKFTNTGFIRVSAEQSPDRDESRGLQYVSFAVADSGIGIPADKLEIIFESFKQVDSSITRRYGGTGLGLSIVKSLVDLLDGEITVQSQPGQGSSFCFRIPFPTHTGRSRAGVSAEDGTAKPAGFDERMAGLAGMKVLIADDNKVNCQLLAIHFKKLGMLCDFAENGLEACVLHQKNKYPLIIMDVQMPEMDGLEAARKIRRAEKNSGEHAVIIALTAGAMQEEIQQCLAAGMDAHISKPVSREKLNNMLRDIIRRP